jgi:hypothetical protein
VAASAKEKFYEVVTAAIADLSECGFDSQARLDGWLRRLEAAARQALVSEQVLQEALKAALVGTYRRLLEGGLARRHRGIDQYTLASIKPKLRAELDRRILAAAGLIRLNREASVARTLQRFAGWATSIPLGGTEVPRRREATRSVRKGVAALPFEERRVIVDQSYKLVSAINDLVATDGGAIAAVWRHVKEANYDARPEHLARDGKVFVLRDNWALKKGYMKLSGARYMDQVTAPGEEIFCRCRYEYLYTLRDLPGRMLTERGRVALAQARHTLGMQHHAYGALQ